MGDEGTGLRAGATGGWRAPLRGENRAPVDADGFHVPASTAGLTDPDWHTLAGVLVPASAPPRRGRHRLGVVAAVAVGVAVALTLPATPPAHDDDARRLDAGFAVLERDPAAAAALFADVLAARPGDVLALEGLGEAALALGDLTTAARHLCRAAHDPGAAGAAAASLLGDRGLRCP